MIAADRWAREVMRAEDRELSFAEQKLMDAVMHYSVVTNNKTQYPVALPKPPNLPKELVDTQKPTMRYSEPDTVPTPAGGFAVDIEEIKKWENGEGWNILKKEDK